MDGKTTATLSTGVQHLSSSRPPDVGTDNLTGGSGVWGGPGLLTGRPLKDFRGLGANV